MSSFESNTSAPEGGPSSTPGSSSHSSHTPKSIDCGCKSCGSVKVGGEMTKLSFLGFPRNFPSNFNKSSPHPSAVMRAPNESILIKIFSFGISCHRDYQVSESTRLSPLRLDIDPGFGSPRMYPSTFCAHCSSSWMQASWMALFASSSLYTLCLGTHRGECKPQFLNKFLSLSLRESRFLSSFSKARK